MRQQKDEVEDIRKQILVPKLLREKVIRDGLQFFVSRTIGSEVNEVQGSN